MIIGFHGTLGSGKDQAGERLAQLVAMPSRRVAFADKLKTSAAASLALPEDFFVQHKNNPNAIIQIRVKDDPVLNGVHRTLTVREFLQLFGTEGHRDVFGDNFWVDMALGPRGEMKHHDSDVGKELIYVTDVRFENEVDGIHARGGYVVHILKGDEPEDYSQIHRSERPLPVVDFTVDNSIRDDHFNSLDRQLEEICNEIGLPLKNGVSVV